MNQIDVVVLTKNSQYILDKCLASIYENVPLNRLIIVDGCSTDNTLSIIDRFSKKHGNVKILTDNGTRATARQKGIGEVETEWFMFVDSDVVLCKDWFRRAEKHTGHDVGAIWGLNLDVIPNVKNKAILKSMALVAKQCFSIRGGMHDILIRCESVKDIEIPEGLHVFEDAYIVNWIKKKGYKVLIGDHIFCLHYKPLEDWNLKENVALGVLEIRSGLAYSPVLRYLSYYPFFAFCWFVQFITKKS